jgi:hypothetical protein
VALAARWIRLEQSDRASLRAKVAGFALAQPPRAAPTVFWAPDDEDGFAFALVVPLMLAPGRPWRWRTWALAPAIATYRQFGQRAYADGDDIWLGGRRIAEGESTASGHCAVIGARFIARLPARADWTERSVIDAFRRRIEAQHGWEFDHSWPSAEEHDAISGALAVEAN